MQMFRHLDAVRTMLLLLRLLLLLLMLMTDADPDDRSQLCDNIAMSQSTVSKGSPYSITERRVPELIPVLGSQPACDVSHKSGGRVPLLSARPAVTLATLKRAATNFAVW